MSSCEQVQELISRMLDEELTPAEAEVLRRHRESCPDCAAMYAAFHALSESLSQDLEEPPASLRENVMAELRREEIRQKHSRRSVWPAIAAAAACLLLVLGLGRIAAPRVDSRSAVTAAVPPSVVTADFSAVNAARGAEAEEAAPEGAAPAERAVFNDAAPAAAAQDSIAELDLSGRMSLERALEILQGEAADADVPLTEPALILRLSDGDLTLYRHEGQLLYADPADGQPMRCACGEDELPALLEGARD